MGFRTMRLALQQVFPQVDARILKHVALYHSKDADAAVEAVLRITLRPAGGPSTPRLCEGHSCDEETTTGTSADEESGRGKSHASEVVSSSSTTPTNQVDNSSAEELDMSTSNICVGNEYESAREVIGEIIACAGNNKKTLLSVMESVISLTWEVELREKAAEQAKVEASVGDANILSKLEELTQTVQLAKESNVMHAGEVYGEKAILATELRELQSRALSLSIEREKSDSLLYEMRQTLEARLAAAENEIKSAEQEKIEKEKADWKALAEQELIMETVVRESKILKQQAEENAKLQEFIVDHDRVMNVLEREIAVICKGVSLLKQSIDENVPFGKCVSSSEPSCILSAPSTSKSPKNLNLEEPLVTGIADPLVVTQSESGPVSFSAKR